MPKKITKQTSLLKYAGFTKQIVHKNRSYNIGDSGFVPDVSGIFKCPSCNEWKKTKQALSQHMMWKHENTNAPKSEAAGKIARYLDEKRQKEAEKENQKGVEEAMNDMLNCIDDCEIVMEDMLKSVTGGTSYDSDIDFNIGTEKPKATQKKPSNPPKGKPRKSYDYRFKMSIIDQVDDGNKPVDVARYHNIDLSLASRWLKNRKEITDNAASKHRVMIKKNKKSTKHEKKFNKLHPLFLDARAKGKMVSYSWLYTKACIISKELYPNRPRLSKSAIWAYIKSRNIKMRRVQRKKRAHKSKLAPELMKWHCTFRESVIKSGSKRPNYDPKWGRFPPAQRINVDQVPLPFAIDRKTTYEPPVPKKDRKDHKVWVSNPAPGLEKRQCSLQVAFSPVENKMRLAIIFRGTGKRISKDETDTYHHGVDVYWQKNAWADTRVCCEWVEKTLAEGVKDFDEFLLLCDNLEGQISDAFKEKVRLIEGLVWYGLKNGTEVWQPVDGGVGRILKVLIGQAQQEWLESDKNLDLWMGNSDDALNAKQRRILITHWAGDSWEKMNSPQYANLFFRCFQRTGCLITADGSDDDKITPEGLVGYVVTPPLPTVTSDCLIEQQVTPDEIPEDLRKEEEEDEVIPEVNDGELEEDNANDHDYGHDLVGRKIRALYNNGWFTGEIKYFNTEMDKLHVLYNDDSEDYIGIDEIDGTDVQFV